MLIIDNDFFCNIIENDIYVVPIMYMSLKYWFLTYLKNGGLYLLKDSDFQLIKEEVLTLFYGGGFY